MVFRFLTNSCIPSGILEISLVFDQRVAGISLCLKNFANLQLRLEDKIRRSLAQAEQSSAVRTKQGFVQYSRTATPLKIPF